MARFWHVHQSCSFNDASSVREAFCVFPNVPETKEKQKKCLNLLFKRESVFGLLPAGFGKSLIYQRFDI